MNKKELYNEELKNIYAMSKQVNHYLDGSSISFLSEDTQQTLMNYLKFSCSLENRVREILDDENTNPGNTIDSIIEEITENLKDISSKNIEDDIKEIGYKCSLNRLISYQISNLDNILFFNLEDQYGQELVEYSKEFANVKKEFFK